MRFDKKPRYSEFIWSERKRKAALAKPFRELKKNQAKYPLFYEQLEVAPALSEQEEIRIRKERADKSEQTFRDFDARVWRSARRQYFDCDDATKSRIKSEWINWRGPATPLYFIYVVEKNNGVAESRNKESRERQSAVRIKIESMIKETDPLPF